MIVLDNGDIAGVRALTYLNNPEVQQDGIAFWVRGRQRVLRSGSYASCVGLVLHGDVPGYGAVAHFWNPSGLEDAKVIVDQYMQWLFQETGGYCGDDVEAMVFGGLALGTPTGTQITRPRIEAISAYLEARWDMRVVVAGVGSSAVSLDLNAHGPIEELVTLDRGKLSSKPHEAKQSAMSKTHKRSPSG